MARIYSFGQPVKPPPKDNPKDSPKDDRIAEAVLPHLDAAYNFARWLSRNDHDAEDVVQEAFLRALRYGDSFTGQNPRAWLFTIVRNTFFSMRKGNIPADTAVQFDEELHREGEAPDPESRMVKSADARIVTEALEELSVEYREVIVLREFEDLSYREIARVAGVPVGTIMSRLARARDHLTRAIKRRMEEAL
jgi:RNA polymerase sigma-70 factor (ECF subfamily)